MKNSESKTGGWRRAKRAGLMVLALAAVAGAGEWGARVWIERSSDESLRAAVEDRLNVAKGGMPEFPFVPDEDLPYRLRPNYLYAPAGFATRTAHNEFGFRGDSWTKEKAGDTLRIVCVGGSATYGTGVLDNSLTYPARLGEYLDSSRKPPDWAGVEVFNLGVEGYTTLEVLETLRSHGLPLNPDVVIVESVYEDVFPRLYPDFQCGYGHFRIPLADYEAGSLARYAFRSRLFLAVGWKLGLLRPLSLDARTRRPLPESPDAAKFLASSSTACYAERLREIIELAGAAGAQVWLATQTYSSHEDFAGQTGAALHAAIRAAVKEHNEIIRALCRETPALFLDAGPLMPRLRSHHTGAVNLSAEGYRVKAKLMVDLMGRRLPARDESS